MNSIEFEGISVDIANVEEMPVYIQDCIYNNSYENDEALLVSKYLDNNDRVLELGCAIGYLGTFAKKKFPGIYWLSVDANPQMALDAQATHQLNNVDMPKPLNVVASLNANGPVPFYIREEFLTSSLLPVELEYSKIIQVEHVPTMNISELMLDVNTLVFDIEGGEANLFTEDLDLANIEKVCLEYHDHFIGLSEVERIHNLIVKRGFTTIEYNTKQFGSVAYYCR